jgi:4-aminobutyrate aminotransferase-like enzyme
VLKADRLLNDPRVKEAKKLLLEALRDAKNQFHGIEAPQHQEEHSKLLQEFASVRGTPLFFPYIGSGLGKGCLVELTDGSCKYDLITGIGVHYFGHSSEEVVSASIDAALSNTLMQGNLQQNRDALELAKLLCKLSDFDHCFLTTSGAMACENALKICFQKKFPASRILAFERCFAGRTLTLAQITDKPLFREGLPATVRVDYIPFFDPQNPIESTKRALDTLKSHIKRYPKQHALMCMELVQGEGGFWTGSQSFFKSIIEVLKAHNIAVMADEVQTFARTESLFAYQYFDLDGLIDVVTIGKLSSACATLYTNEFTPTPSLLSQTFTASTGAIRIGKMTIEHALSHNFFGPTGKIHKLYEAFTEGLHKLHEKYGCLHGPYGLGSMIAFTPFEGDDVHVRAFVQKLFANGVISFVAGSNPTRVRFLLPVGCMTIDDIDPIMKIIEKTVQECMP